MQQACGRGSEERSYELFFFSFLLLLAYLFLVLLDCCDGSFGFWFALDRLLRFCVFAFALHDTHTLYSALSLSLLMATMENLPLD